MSFRKSNITILLIIVIIHACGIQKSWSQLSPVISQYSFNAFLLNPAAAGSEGYTTFNLSARKQWVCIPGAPETVSLDFQTRIYKKAFIPSSASVRKKHIKRVRSGRVGLGLHISNDRHGVFDRNEIQFSYAYHIVRTGSQLSFGLAFSLMQFKINLDRATLETENDYLLSSLESVFFTPDFNAGVYYTNQDLFAGISATSLTKMSENFNLYSHENYLQRILNILGGYKINMDDKLELVPSLYFKWADFRAVQLDINTKLTYKKILWCGLTYRTEKTVCLHGGFRLSRVYIGYAYEFNAFLPNTFFCSTHELMVAVKLGDNVRRYKWLERY